MLVLLLERPIKQAKREVAVTETCGKEDENMETVEQYNQGSEMFPVTAGMTKADEIEPSKTVGIPSYLVRRPWRPGGG